MHPYIAASLANTFTRDRVSAAARRSAATASRRTPGAGSRDAGALVIRRAGAADAPALERLGSLDADRRTGALLGRLARRQAVLIAEVDGRLEAALALDGRVAVADPFRPSRVHAELLALRARQLGGDGPGGHAGRMHLGVLAPRLP
jgi:hypothetical protein